MRTLARLVLTLGLLTASPILNDGGNKIVNTESIEQKINQETKTSYEKIQEEIKNKQQEFGEQYSQATNEEKKLIITDAREYLFNKMVDDVFEEWYGTQWSMNGTTRVPKEGTIACGYFVTTVLEDVGFKVPRVTWSVIPSENMIREMTQKENFKRFSSKSAGFMEEYIKEQGEGLYATGLDCHTGFIVNREETAWFVHADYYEPWTGVKAEKINGYNPFAHSKYRVIGKILDDKMMDKWLTGTSFYTDFTINWKSNPHYYRKGNK